MGAKRNVGDSQEPRPRGLGARNFADLREIGREKLTANDAQHFFHSTRKDEIGDWEASLNSALRVDPTAVAQLKR